MPNTMRQAGANIMDSLSLKQKIAQMVIVRASGFSLDHQRLYPQWELDNQLLEDLITNYGIGGIILVGGSVAEVKQRTNHWQSLTKIPLFICADVEEGVGQRFAGAVRFPPPMALAEIWQKDRQLALNLAEQMGRITACESLAIGINWLLAPVADVNSNPHNPVINVRSFGTTPLQVSELTCAFHKGAHTYPILTTAKHFPGHGDTSIDSHLLTPTIHSDRQHFFDIEFPPFQALISQGIDSIMTAHLIAEVWDRENIATFSQKIVQDLLRNELGFRGLIITDALVMGGVGKLSSAEMAIKAIQAGVDILLMTPDVIAAIEAIYAAVMDGIITEERIEQSFNRIMQAKYKLQTNNTTPKFKILGNAEHNLYATTIAHNALRYYLPHNQPINITGTLHLFCSDRPHQSDSITQQQLSPLLPIPLDQRMLSYLNLPNTPPVFLEISSRGNPFRGTAGWQVELENFITKLVALGKLHLIILYGSPYNLEKLLPLLPSEVPWGFAYSELARKNILEKLIVLEQM
jgi:beta-glucosidase